MAVPADDETAPASPTGTTQASADDDAPPPQRLTVPARYRLAEVLGRGGMGVVWRAHDTVLDRTVALKVLHDRFGAGGFQQRLADEARAMARLNHPNVVVVYDVGVHDGRTYLTMELIRGQTMSRWLATPRTWQEVVTAFRAAGEGVAAAHAAGIVHRDLKPSNVLIGDDGRVRVADFGVADARDPAELAGDVPLADTASTSGTPAYMAPERFRGAAADPRSDQFSFAASLYEALHGRRPFEAANVAGLIDAMAGPSPAPLRNVPAWLTRVVNRGLARDPAARFPSMAALVSALAHRRRGWWAAGAGAVIVAGAATAVLATGGEARCDDGRAALIGVWDGATEQRLAAATSPFLAAEVAAHADRWVGARDELCRAAHVYGELDAPAAAVGTGCLDAQRRVLGLVVERLTAGGDRRTALLGPLPAAGDCVDRERLAHMSGPGGEELAQARAALAVGDVAAAAAHAETAEAAARGAADVVSEIEALLVRGEALTSVRPGAAAEVMTAAIERSVPVGVTALRVDAWLGLAGAQLLLGQRDTGVSLVALAEMALADRALPERAAELALVTGRIAAQQGRHTDAVAAFRRAREALAGVHGVATATLLGPGRLLVTSLLALGRADEAVAIATDDLALARQLGADHVEVARAQLSLGGALAARGELAPARDELDRAVAGLRVVLGPSPEGAAALAALGDVLARAGDRDGAIARASEAVAMAREVRVAASDAARLVRSLALLLADREPARAEGLLRAALGEQLTALGPHHPEVAATRRALAEVLVALGRPAEP